MKGACLLVCLFVAGCAKHPDVPTASPGPVRFDFALYFAPAPSTDPEVALAQVLAQDFPAINEVLSLEHRWVALADYPPPTAEALRYTSHGITSEQQVEVLQSARVFVLTFAIARERTLPGNRVANDLVARLAAATAGFPWDDTCRLIYSVEEWRQKRVATWQDDLPDVRGHVNMHAYRNPELVRLITLGMGKFGLPDLVLAEIPSGNTRAAGNLMNAFAQHLLEGARPDGRKIRFKFSQLRHERMRTETMENPLEGATGEVRLTVRAAEPEEGDPNNALWSLEFPYFEGNTPTERALTALASAFGAKDEIVEHRSGDQAMLQASERARKLFFEREADFRRGLAPNERLLVKAGFNVAGEKEYMWVEVTSWKTDAVEGTLANDSYYDENLREGVHVTVKLADVFDFIHYKPDGTKEGNETAKVLEQQRTN